MRVLRLSLVAATAVIAAACGDKVNVVGPSSTAGKIESVVIAPLSSTISVGQTVTLSAAVNSDVGITPTVAWTSSSSAATLSASSATGTTVTGASAAPGGVAICATASAAGVASVGNCATVIIQPAQTITPATIQITSVTGANLNTPVAVPPGAIAGQINISVTANPGTEKLDSVVVLLNGKSAGVQTFTAAQAAALRSAGNAAVANQQVLAPLVFSVNTGAYNTTTGAVTYPNGNVLISAVAYGHQGTSAASNVASNSLSYILGNADAWAITQTLSSTLVANNAAGFNFNTGAVTVNAIPVLYSGLAIASANVNFGTAACDLSGGPQRSQALVAPAAGTYAWTATFAKTSATTAGTAADVNSYEYSTACASNAGGGEGAVIASSNYTNSVTGPTGLSAGIANPVVRLDNRAPAAPVANLNPNGRANNWVNDAVTFNGVATSSAAALAGAGAGITSNGMVCNNLSAFVQGNCAVGAVAPTDAGVGGVVFSGRVGATIAAAGTATAIANPTTLAPSATNLTYCLALYSSDALGNTSKTPVACTTTFGVDRVAPVFAYQGGIAANARLGGGSIGSEVIVAFSDTGLVGNSGMSYGAGLPVVANMTLRNVTATGAATCIVGTYAATVCGQSTTGLVTSLGTGTASTGVTASTTIGYYTYAATATDAAGNQTVVAPKVFVYDNTALTVGVASTPVTVSGTAGFAASAFASAQLDIQSFFWTVNYVTLPFAPTVVAQGNVTQVNGYNATPFINTNYVATSTVTLPLAFQQDPTGATLYPLSGVEANVTGQGNITTVGAAGAPTTVTPGTAISLTGFTSYPAPSLPATITGISSGVTTAATAVAPATTTVSATAVGVTATFNLPFSRVDFYAQNATATQWILIGSVATPSLVDIGGNRTFTWPLAVSGATLYTQLGLAATTTVNVMGVGIGGANSAIGMIPAATFALQIIK